MLNNKEFILITGSSSGFGRQAAIQLSENYNLILCARNEKNLLETKEKCNKNSNVLIFPYDLSDVENLEGALISFIKENNIVISKFLHSAGMLQLVPLKSTDLNYIKTAFNVNLISAQLIIKTLINRRHNASSLNNVVLISSNISNFGAKAFSTYSATKSGLDGLMRSLAVELAPKVRVNSILPGGVSTNMTKEIEINNERSDSAKAACPMGEGQPKNIADAAEFLFSDKSSWITGQQITVDGGRNINLTE